MIFNVYSFLLFAASVSAHSNMFFPVPRADSSYAFQDGNQNACENENTNIPGENNFKRGDAINPKWWWNNHRGGFVKFAIVKGINGRVDNAPFLENKNILAGQCYTGACDQNGFDPGNTHPCNGKPFTIPDWVEDGDYVLQWSQIGGFDSDGIPTKALPLYHTCANIRISGGATLVPQPNDWIAPFTGGSQDRIRGQSGPDGTCGFKVFTKEPSNPRDVDVNRNVNVEDMEFGVPDGWARSGGGGSGGAAVIAVPSNNEDNKDTTESAGSGSGSGGSTYTVASGDFCDKIASANGISVSKLRSLNPEINSGCTNLSVGQQLKLSRRRSRVMKRFTAHV